MKRLFVIFLGLIILTGCGVDSSSDEKFITVDSEEAMKLMKEESGYAIVDVRTFDEYKGGHIPEAVNIPNDDIGEIELDYIPDKHQLIFLYCRSGARSHEAAVKLADMGYTRIVDFGGIKDWKGEVVVE